MGYRTAKKINYYKILLPKKDCTFPEESLNKSPKEVLKFSWTKVAKAECLNSADQLLNGIFTFYGLHPFNVGSPPNWFEEPFSKQIYFGKDKHWSELKYFTNSDIKNYWELSRWTWAPILARAWRYSGNKKYIQCLNEWMQSWCNQNPVNCGCNWLCSQEVSIRLIHALQSFLILDGTRQYPYLTNYRKAFTLSHLKRIYTTQLYAKAQNNNHWLSEAAALFIGGSWCNDKFFSEKGRISLEKCVSKLIMEDGSFSQHSVNYHRLVIDTLNQVEIWRRLLGEKPFSDRYYILFNKAYKWMIDFVDPICGDAPNLGANDGAYCFALHNMPFRDFRPTLQLSSNLLTGKFIYGEGPWNESFSWLNIKCNFIDFSNIKYKKTNVYKDGGYVVIRPSLKTWSLLKLPIYKFRPSQADPLHFDLWHNGNNILKDAGSYSYHCNKKDFNYFSGVESHNTVQFDNEQPMNRISRFLWNNWLKLDSSLEIKDNETNLSIGASYSCNHGRHKRKIMVNSDGLKWEITDEIISHKRKATIRWRLSNDNWILDGLTLKSSLAKIRIKENISIVKCEITDGWESRFYGYKSKIKVLKIEIEGELNIIKTIINLY